MSSPHPRRWPKVLAIVVLALVVLVAGLVLALDRILLSQARRQAAALSRDLGRPIAVGDVSTKLRGGLGVRVTGISVGAGEGEGVPLAELGRAEVQVDLLRALRTRGRQLHVREAVVEGFHLNVVKLPDGRTNLERVADALSRTQPPAEPSAAPAGPAERQAPSGPPFDVLRVDRAAVEDARIAFLDRTVPGAKELFVEDLDVEVRDLETGKPVEVLVRAAVLADHQNLELRVKAAPLPPSLQPVPDEITLRVEPIVLDPLAAFVPASVGFRGGRLEADLGVKLGAAVPGGAGPTRAKGALRATGLAFRGQEGGRPLDIVLDADLEGDAAAGDLRIGKLELVAGPATFTGRGRATGLRGDVPRFEALELVGRGIDPEALAAYYPPLRRALGDAVVAGPIALTVRGSGSAAAQTAEARIDLTPVRLAVPAQLAKAAGAPMSFVVRADLGQGGGNARFDAALDLAGVDLRPGGSVAKKPGDPLSVKTAGTYRAKGDTRELGIDRLEVVALADRLDGKAQVRLTGTGAKATTRFDADLHGDRLDLDRLLLPAPAEKRAKPGAAAAPGHGPAKPLDPAAFAGLSGTAALRLGVLRTKGLDARNVVARVRVEGDQLTVEEARLDAFGGAVSAAGTRLALARPDAPFEVALDLRGVAGEEALRFLSDRKVLTGTLDTKLRLSGTGWQVGLLTRSVTGGIEGTLRGGSFYGKDLVASVAQPLAAKLPFAASRVPDGGATKLGKELPFAFAVRDGLASLTRPLRAEAGDAALAIEGGVRFDGSLEMPGTVSLSPELIARITGGKARPKEPIPVAFRLAGPAWKPRVEALSLEPAVKAIVDQVAAGALGRALGVEGSSAKDVAEAKREQAEARAREAAEEKKKKLEEEAKKRLRGLFGR